MLRFPQVILLSAVALLAAAPAQPDPLYARNLSPLSGLFGFPALREARALAPGQFSAAVLGNVANTYSVDDNAREDYNIDVESRRLAFRGARRLGRGWEL